VLVAAGGAGPVHAGAIAKELELPVVLIPKYSSIFCASGMLFTDIKYDFVRGYVEFLSALERTKFNKLFEEMETEGRQRLKEAGIPDDRMEFLHSCDVRYFGQITEVEVSIAKEEIESFDLSQMMLRFHDKHNRLYGYDLRDMPFDNELVACRVTAVGKTDKPILKEQKRCDPDCSSFRKGMRKVYLPSKGEFTDVGVFDGDRMEYGNKVTGPAIVEQAITSILVLPEYDLVCDRLGSFVMYLKEVEDRLREEKEGILPI
jgi:N-methylhydantoinase A